MQETGYIIVMAGKGVGLLTVLPIGGMAGGLLLLAMGLVVQE
jgi:hypothetical protein